MEEERSKVKTDIIENWPLSNYPILLAIMLLVATAISFGLGSSETNANQLAMYAYFLLVIGVAIRFFELTLPETLIKRITEKISVKKGIDDRKENKFDFLADVTKNVFIFLLLLFFLALSYGALVDWIFIEGFIQKLVYFIAAFLALHLILRSRGG
ncbi:MAG: hypothetical protein WA130_18155 [Candidatus Methanoperedens sp.]